MKKDAYNLALLCDFYELTMSRGYFHSDVKDKIAYFDVFFRRVPDGGGYAITAGLEQINEQGRLCFFVQRNKVSVGDWAEIISPSKIGQPFLVEELYDELGAPLSSAPHPSMRFWTRVPFEVAAGDIMRSGEAPTERTSYALA